MSLSQEQKDIIEIKHNVDRIENHFKVYKNDVIDIGKDVQEIKLLLGGSHLNGNKGFIRLMEAVETKVDLLEKENTNLLKDIEGIKFWGRGSAGVLFVAIGILIKKIIDL
jgi:hypothetical protein